MKLVFIASALALATTVSSAAGSVVLPGHVARVVRASALLGRAASDENVPLSLYLRLDQAQMDRTLAALYGPGAPRNKSFLTPAQFGALFGVAAKRRAVERFARAAGLAVAPSAAPNDLVVHVSGSAAAVQGAFGLILNRYRAPDGQIFRAAESDPRIPASLMPHLLAVMGLSNYRGAAKPHVRRAARVAGARTLSGGTGPGGELAPVDIKKIYGLTPGKLTGAGQEMALVEYDGFAPSDVGLYETTFFSAPYSTVTAVAVDGQANLCGPNQSDPCNSTTLNGGQPDQTTTGADNGMGEVALDIDMALALSSGAANIAVYIAPSSTTVDVYAQIAADDAAKAVSTSWGLDEDDEGTAAMSAEATVFQQMATQGQSIFSAAGDQGAYDAASVTGSIDATNTLVTDDPASQPYVTGVGGTSLSGTVGGAITETVWNGVPGSLCSGSAIANCQNYGAGGGGIADRPNGSYWPIPSYQSGVGTLYSTAYRNVPDVSLNADPNSSFYAVCVGGSCANAIGGTSAASPLWAALANLVNQARVAGGYSTLGFANPPLYQLAMGGGSGYAYNFNDVTSGNNGYYNAGTGYDNATGWGSFRADHLIASLSAPETVAVSGLSASTLGISSITWNWTAAANTAYNVYNATAPAQQLGSAIQPPFIRSGLAPDAAAGVIVYPTVDGIQGSAPVSLATATYAEPPTSSPVVVGYTSSATFTYAACSAPPSAQSCSGYAVLVSTDAGFTGTLYSSATPSVGLTSLTLNGLVSGIYYVKLAYANPYGFPSYGPSTTFNTNALIPASPAFSSISATAITFSWSTGGNPPGELYVAQASTAPDYSGALLTQSGTALSQTFNGLASDTSYYFRVQGSGGPFLDAGPQATVAAAPTAVSPAFVAVASTTLVVQWSANGNAADAAYEADISSYATFASFSSADVAATSAAFAGLSANTTYYARARAFGRAGAPTVYVLIGSTLTLAAPPALAAPPFTALSTGSLVAVVNPAGNPAGTRYVFQLSTSPVFATLNAALTTTATDAAFGGLLSNATFYVQVAALNSAGAQTAFSVPAATATLAAMPAAAGAPVAVSSTALALQWSTNGFAPGTSYSAAVSLTASPFTAAASSIAVGGSAVVSGLAPNTTYFAQVAAQSLSSDPNGAPSALGSGSTLAAPVAAAAFQQVFVSTLSVGWTAAAGNEGYRVDLSTSPTFATLSVSVFAPPAASSALVSGLFYDTTYYARVGTLNWQGAADYFSAAGSTTTGAPTLSTGTSGAGNLVLFLPLSPPLISLTVTIPAGAFAAGTTASAIEGFFGTPLTTLSGAGSNESAITPAGPQAAFCVSGASTCLYSGGPQPSAPVLFSVAYNPGQLPAGDAESALQLMRYDPAAGQWTIVASHDDASAHVLTAYTTHFSLFAPFFMTAATTGDLSPVQIFPQPWELGAPGSPYYANVLTFSNLPAGAQVKLFTLSGELVWEGSSSAFGVATWDGHNRFGRAAASGTYLCAISSGGTRRLRRVVLIR